MQTVCLTRARHDAPHCGDQCRYWRNGERTILAVADGLGHGEAAEAAAMSALDHVADNLSLPLTAMFEGCHRAVRATRGAALSVAALDYASNEMGNVAAAVIGAGDHAVSIRHFSNNNGIVGGGFNTLFQERASMAAGDLLVIYTDGIMPLHRLAAVPWTEGTPAKIAAIIIEQGRLEADDAGILVSRGRERAVIFQSFQERYVELMVAFADEPREEYLSQAAELGREMVRLDIPPEDVGEYHQAALDHLERHRPDLPRKLLVRTSAMQVEMLMAYGLAFRERLELLKNSRAEIERSNAELELRVGERTAELRASRNSWPP